MKTIKNGFTLIELLATILILATITSFAVPGYHNMTSRNRSLGAVIGLMTDMKFARNEAIKRGQNVTICQGDETGCNVPGGPDWHTGWTVVSGANVIRFRPALATGDALTGDGAGTLSFNRYGFTTTRAIKYCDREDSDALARAILVSRTGHIRFATDTDSSGVVDDGTNDFSCP